MRIGSLLVQPLDTGQRSGPFSVVLMDESAGEEITVPADRVADVQLALGTAAGLAPAALTYVEHLAAAAEHLPGFPVDLLDAIYSAWLTHDPAPELDPQQHIVELRVLAASRGNAEGLAGRLHSVLADYDIEPLVAFAPLGREPGDPATFSIALRSSATRVYRNPDEPHPHAATAEALVRLDLDPDND